MFLEIICENMLFPSIVYRFVKIHFRLSSKELRHGMGFVNSFTLISGKGT